jgi:hypothetical protein
MTESEFGPRGIGMEFMTDSLVISEKGSSDIVGEIGLLG